MPFSQKSRVIAGFTAGLATATFAPAPLAAQDIHPGDVTILGSLTIPFGNIQLDLGSLTATSGSVSAGTSLNGASLAVTGNAAIGGDLTTTGTTSSGALCAGNDCAGTSTVLDHALIVSEEAGSGGVAMLMTHGPSGTDWSLGANLTGSDRFSIQNLAPTGRTPFVLEEAARTNALYVAGGGVGLGTSLPQADLHVTDGVTTALRLAVDGSTGATPQTYDLIVGGGAFSIYDETGGTYPIYINDGAASDLVNLVGESLHVGFWESGTENSRLHVRGEVGGKSLLIDVAGLPMLAAPPTIGLRGNDASTWMLIEELNAATSPRTMLSLQNNGRPEIVMGNTGTGGEWSFGAGTNFILKQGAVGSSSAAKTKLFQVNANGDAELLGSLTTGGTTCGGGCDAVFTENRVIPAEQYHAAMWDQGHLPHVGPTPEGAPFNVTQKLGGMLNALEHAHVFIAELRAENAQLQADKAAMAARMARIEAQVAALLAAR